ncbi:MAG: hypothetical protein IKG44_02245 [Mogibacterium sp.]|nr:hypothetical protein [Mogibacterium sp.]
MKIGILIRDAEYRDALAEKLSLYDNDLYVNIIDNSTKHTSDYLILTDIRPDEIDQKTLTAIKARTVFLIDTINDDLKGFNTVFKYGSVSNLISELSIVYNNWHGSGPGRNYSARLLAVCCESDAYSSAICSSLARQVIYRHGGRVLIIPMAFINDYGRLDCDINTISRLLYSIHTGHERSSDSFTYTDAYGVSAIMLPSGRNPVAYLDESELKSLIAGLAKRFDTIICDLGTCFRNENILVMKESDRIILYETGRRVLGVEEMIGKETCSKLIRIKLTGEADEAIAMDDCIKQVFNNDNNGQIKSSNNKRIRE